MNDTRDHKAGLFRRLFGMDYADSENVNKADAKDAKQREDGKLSDESLLPSDLSQYDTSTAVEDHNVSPYSEDELPRALVRGGQKSIPHRDSNLSASPSWEELLNKIMLSTPRTPSEDADPFSPTQNTGQTQGQRSINRTVNSPKAKNNPWLEDEHKPETLPWEQTPGHEPASLPDSVQELETDQASDTDQPQQGNGPEELTLVMPTNQELKVMTTPLSSGQPLGPEAETSGLQGRVNELCPEVKKVHAPMKNDQVIWLLQQAQEMDAKGELDKAEKLLEVALTLDFHPDVLLALGKHQMLVGNNVKGADFVLKAMEQNPDSLEAIEVMAKLAEAVGRLDLHRIAVLAPGTSEGSVKLAQLCLAHGFLTESLDFFAKAQSFGLDVDSIQFDLGRLYQGLGNAPEAIKHYARDLILRGDLNTALVLFDLFLDNGLFSEADSAATKYLMECKDPEVVQKLAGLNLIIGTGLLDKQELEGALDRFSLSLEQGCEDARVWVVKTLLMMAELSGSEDYVKSQEWLELAMELGGFEFHIAEKLAASYVNGGNDQKALGLLRNLHELEPENIPVIARLAKVLHKVGELDQAAALLETLASRGKLDPETREQLFSFYRGQGRFEEAKRHLEAIYRPGSEAYEAGVRGLVWEEISYLVEQGDLDKAWEICRSELQSRPSPDMLGMGMRILTERVDALGAGDKVNEALEVLAEGQAMGLNVLDLGLREAALYESLGNDRAALNVYEAIALKAPEVWVKIKELYLKAATREYLAGNMSEARRLLENAYNKLPKNEEICRALGVLYQETGQYNLAAALVRDSMEETEIQVPTDHLNVLRPHGYRRIRLG